MMSAEPIAPALDEQISTLIETLHLTEQRLEELTSGEVDTVANHNGRTLLLRRAQEHLRLNGAAKQAAIVNALPAHIALLDAGGRIVSVNDAWRRFADANALLSPAYGVGLNYLAICDAVCGEDAAAASEAAAGIRSVQAGSAQSFSLEYSCHVSEEQRWFLMSASPLVEDPHDGVVVMHFDRTKERQTTESLRASESRFREMAENIHDAFFLLEADGSRVLYISPAYEEIWGRSCASLYANAESWIEAIHPDDRVSTIENYKRGIDAGKFTLEFRIVRPDGGIRWIDVRSYSVLDDAGRIARIAGVAKDVTERKEANDRIAYLNRVYAMLSRIKTLIVRVHSRDELFKDACRIAFEEGGFRGAWIGIIDHSAMRINPVASAGVDQELLNFLKEGFSFGQGTSTGNTIAAQAIRGRKVVVANDLSVSPTVVFGKKYAMSGINSIAILPLIVSDVVIGVLALYAGEREFFKEEELKLVTELAGDIAFAIDHIEKQDHLNYLAYYDLLTGLANRSLFLERVAQYTRTAAAGGHQLALFLIDLERFKNINDSLGRCSGDALLKQVADWMRQNMGEATLLARVGPDHFAVVLPEVEQGREVARLVEKMAKSFMAHPFRLDDGVFRLAAKVGVALFPEDGADAETLFRNAEAALKRAKARGDRYLFYTQKMNEAVAGKLDLENQLRRALDEEEFVLHYQPKVNLVTGKITGAEALIRWNDPRTGLVPPVRFIPILEETGLIYDVGRWALRRAIGDYLRWRAAGLPVVRIAVNMSPLQLRHRDFIAEIRQVVGIEAHAAAGLELEITESLIMQDIRHSITSLAEIRAMGVTVAIDDFGTGFSSLSYLAKLPVDTLKIDRSFVFQMTDNPEGLALVSTIIQLAHALKLNVVAEGVETEEQSRLLRLLSCNDMQGFLFSKPVPADVFEARFLAPLPAG